MVITTLINKGVLIVRVDGELDMHVTENFRDTLDKCMDNTGIKDVILNLQRVEFIDSSGIGAILGRYKKIHFMGGHLCIVGIQPVVKRIFDLAGLFKIIKAYPTETDAFTCL